MLSRRIFRRQRDPHAAADAGAMVGERVEAGHYRIIAAHSGRVADVEGAKHSGRMFDGFQGSQASGAKVIQWDWWGGANQQWRR